MVNFIDGKWQEANGESFSSISPIDESSLWQSQTASKEDVDAAIEAAQKASTSWSRLGFDKRKSYIESFINSLEENRVELSELLCKENGKVLKEANMEISGMIGKFKISISAYEDRCKELKKDLGFAQSITRHKAHGVVAIFGPYNFPGHVPNGHIIPALLAGNTIVFKPSELTPAFSEKIIKLWQESKIPNGVINLVQGKSDTGIALANHPGIDGLFFTGSSKTGKILHKNFAGNPAKILALELGGNNPLCCHQVKDIDKTVDLIIQSAFITNGQRCTCARRLILIKGKEAEEILEALKKKVLEISIGNPLEDKFMGPVISKEQAENLIQSQKSLIEKGAQIIVKMEKLNELGPSYVSPGILDCSNAEKLEDEEYFGPLLQVYLAQDFNHALQIANNTDYGLSAGLISQDKNLFEEFYWQLKAGLINWNNQLTGASSSAPFGGVGLSGNHRPSAYYAADYCAYPVASLESEL